MSKVLSKALQDHSGGLARKSVTPFEVGAQSVANIAPSAVIAFGPGAMAASAGNGAWFSFLIGTVIILLVAQSIVTIARRRAGAGSLYSLIRPALGPSGTFVTGWALFIGVVGIAAGSLAGAGFFASRVLERFGFTAFAGTNGQIIFDLILLVAGVYVTIASVRTAARVSASLEIISIVVIVLVLVTVMFKSGNWIDSPQFSLSGAKLDGIVFAIVLAILGFVGFEGAAALGEESDDPFRAIPRAIRGGALFAGVLYIFATYSQVAAFKGGASALAKSGSPMDDLASQYGLSSVQPLLNLGFAASFIAVVMACVTVGARLLFSWGNEGLLPAWFGKAHPKHRTPANSIYVMVPLVAIPTVGVLLAGAAPLAATTYIDTVGVFGYMLAYIVVCLGAPVFLKRINVSGVATMWVTGVLGAGSLVYVFYRNVIPVPPSPLNTLPYYFLGFMVLGLIWFAILKVRRPAAVELVGTFADDAPISV
jgi:amino acid transporter